MIWVRVVFFCFVQPVCGSEKDNPPLGVESLFGEGLAITPHAQSFTRRCYLRQRDQPLFAAPSQEPIRDLNQCLASLSQLAIRNAVWWSCLPRRRVASVQQVLGCSVVVDVLLLGCLHPKKPDTVAIKSLQRVARLGHPEIEVRHLSRELMWIESDEPRQLVRNQPRHVCGERHSQSFFREQ